MNKSIICLMGPTACGKTELACRLFKEFPVEIISVDSMLIYRGMNIGTAKPCVKTLAKIPHHLVDILDPPQIYSAANFVTDAKKLIKDIWSRNKIPLLVGGTMMYFRALQDGIAAMPSANSGVRAKIVEQAKLHGWPYMHAILKAVDPKSADKINPHDSQRLQRALEVYEITKKPLSSLQGIVGDESFGNFYNLILLPEDRVWLHARIAERFNTMLEGGFVAEVEDLLTKWKLDLSFPSMRAVGYRQVYEYLQGKYSYNDMQAKGIAATRQLAKRQITWLRSWRLGYKILPESALVDRKTVELLGKILDNPL